MTTEIKVFEKEYHGFESAVDIERDVSEMWHSNPASSIPVEFQGTLKVVITYVPEEGE